MSSSEYLLGSTARTINNQPMTDGKDTTMRTILRPNLSIRNPPVRAPNKAPKLTKDPTRDISVLVRLIYQTLSGSVIFGGTVAFSTCWSCGWTGEDHPRKVPRMKAPHEAMFLNINMTEVQFKSRTNSYLLLLRWTRGLCVKRSNLFQC